MLNLPRLEAREQRERLQERGVRIPGPQLLEMLKREGMGEEAAQDVVSRVLAGRALADIEAEAGQ